MSVLCSGQDANPYLCCFGHEKDNIFLHIITDIEKPAVTPKLNKCCVKKCPCNGEESVIDEVDFEAVGPPKLPKPSEEPQPVKKCEKESSSQCKHSNESCCDICCCGVPDGKQFCCYICCKAYTGVKENKQQGDWFNKQYTLKGNLKETKTDEAPKQKKTLKEKLFPCFKKKKKVKKYESPTEAQMDSSTLQCCTYVCHGPYKRESITETSCKCRKPCTINPERKRKTLLLECCTNQSDRDVTGCTCDIDLMSSRHR